MSELIQRLRDKDERDRGAVATVFAMTLAGGVLLGFLALVVDIGQIYVEREELRGGADAAALAVARACATNAVDCASASSLTGLAQRFADDNASDRLARVVAVCGRLPGRFEPCPEPVGNLTDCLGAAPAEPTGYVEVHLSTEVAGDRFVLPPVFAASLADNAGYAGTAVAACARATWTPPAELSIVALTLSDCDVALATAGGVGDPAMPSPADERTIELVPGHGPCPTDPPDPWSPAGEVAWLAGDGNCEVARMSDQPGTLDPQPGPNCLARLRQAREAREIIYIPVYDRVSPGAPERTYHVTAVAAFLVTGWQLGEPSQVVSSSLGAELPCGDSTRRCVSGVFVSEAVALSDLTGGTAVVNLIG